LEGLYRTGKFISFVSGSFAVAILNTRSIAQRFNVVSHGRLDTLLVHHLEKFLGRPS